MLLAGLGALIVLIGCGPPEETQVENAVNLYVKGHATHDARLVCSLLAKEYLDDRYPTERDEPCEDLVRDRFPETPREKKWWRQLRATRVEVEGDTADAALRLGECELEVPGARLRKVDGRWLVVVYSTATTGQHSLCRED